MMTPGRPISPTPVPAPASGTPVGGVLLGAGRSGIVFKVRDAHGRAVARKVFDSDALTRTIQYVFLGAANPYTWNEHAIETALLRRRILARLVPHWFGERLRVAEAWSREWNEEYLAFQLSTEFVDGSPPTLHHPMNKRGAVEVKELVHEIMEPLQERLLESGFDGLVWQAGRGNPVALANFLREDTADGGRRWAWIDLESGVPALFPANPVELFRFYLPRCRRFRRPLFDDVDIARLGSYLEENRAALESDLGTDAFGEMTRDVTRLGFHQKEWKSQPRIERSIESQFKKGRISAEQAELYRRHRARWYARELRRGTVGIAVRARGWIKRHWPRIAQLPWSRLPLGVLRFLCSQRFRSGLAQAFVGRRIDSWERRGQLLPAEATKLRGHLGEEESSSYLTDFGVHIVIKPFVKSIEWFLFPTLYAAGLIDETTLGIAVLAGGSIARTLYTSGRFVQSFLHGRELPWIALGTGALPVVGNLAYPLQIVYSSHEEDDILAQFILYDGFSAMGHKLPIWGGKDTLTEHAFNHLPDRVVRGRKPAPTL